MKEAILTTQVDLCADMTIEFREDSFGPDSSVYSAGVCSLGIVAGDALRTTIDYNDAGAVWSSNASPEEVHFRTRRALAPCIAPPQASDPPGTTTELKTNCVKGRVASSHVLMQPSYCCIPGCGSES